MKTQMTPTAKQLLHSNPTRKASVLTLFAVAWLTAATVFAACGMMSVYGQYHETSVDGCPDTPCLKKWKDGDDGFCTQNPPPGITIDPCSYCILSDDVPTLMNFIEGECVWVENVILPDESTYTGWTCQTDANSHSYTSPDICTTTQDCPLDPAECGEECEDFYS